MVYHVLDIASFGKKEDITQDFAESINTLNIIKKTNAVNTIYATYVSRQPNISLKHVHMKYLVTYARKSIILITTPEEKSMLTIKRQRTQTKPKNIQND